MDKDGCFRCGEEQGLMDAIYENELVKVCERCAKLESIPVLKKPSSNQLDEAERPYSVYERLALMSGMKEKAELKAKQEKKEVSLDKLRKVNFLQDRKQKPELKQELQLKDNFHWDIFRARRKKGIQQKQFAEKLGVEEEEVKALEYGQLMEGSEELIKKVEQILEISLRKPSYIEKVRHLPLEKTVQKQQEEEKEKKIEVLEKENVEEEIEEELREEIKQETEEEALDLDKEDVKISDLNKLKENEIEQKIQAAARRIGNTSEAGVTLAELQERKWREKQEEKQETEDWRGKTKEEREKLKLKEDNAEKLISDTGLEEI